MVMGYSYYSLLVQLSNSDNNQILLAGNHFFIEKRGYRIYRPIYPQLTILDDLSAPPIYIVSAGWSKFIYWIHPLKKFQKMENNDQQ